MTDLVQRLLDCIEAKRRRIIVIGDALTDVWVHGRVTECQDDCPKFVEESRVTTPGGAANAQRSISNWGVMTDLYAISEDERPVKTRFLADGKIVYRHDDEREYHRHDDHNGGYGWAHDVIVEMIGRAGAVLLSDYDKGFLTPEFIQRIAAMCHAGNIPCVADCKRPPGLYVGCTFKCNADYQHRHNNDLSKVAYDGEQPLVVTDGPLNPAVWDGGKIQKGFPFLPPVGCVNHVGAGDCFGAHLTLALAYGFSLKDAAALAHSAGRVYVQHLHNCPPTPATISADMSSAT